MEEPAKSPKGRERIIEGAIMVNPEALGFPGALSIRTMRVSPDTGLVDIVLLPKKNRDHLVLVEAKAATAHDAACKVVGQLSMYYYGALRLGSEGLVVMRKFAEKQPDLARSVIKTSHCTLTGKETSEAAWQTLIQGNPIEAKQIKMFVALDGNPRLALRPTLTTLSQRHKLSIGLVVVIDERSQTYGNHQSAGTSCC